MATPPVPQTVEISKEIALEIAQGNKSGFSSIHKFGEAIDIDTADNFVDVWDGVDATLGTGKIGSYTYSTSADIDSLSSSNDSDTEPIEVHGLDTDFNLVVQTITLTGQTRVALTTALVRVHRMINVGSTGLAGDLYCYVNGSITLGVPQTAADVRAIIKSGNEQTQMALYTIPNGKTGYLLRWNASISMRQNQLSDIQMRVRPNGQVFQLKHNGSLLPTGASHQIHSNVVPIPYAAKTDIAFRADTSADNGSVFIFFELILIDD